MLAVPLSSSSRASSRWLRSAAGMTTESLRLRPSLRVSVTCIGFPVVSKILSGRGYRRELVRVRGLEPPRLAALEPKSSASTSSATPARRPVGRGRVHIWQEHGKVKAADGPACPAAAPPPQNPSRQAQWPTNRASWNVQCLPDHAPYCTLFASTALFRDRATSTPLACDHAIILIAWRFSPFRPAGTRPAYTPAALTGARVEA